MTDDTKLPLSPNNLTEQLLAQLRETAPQIFSEEKVDWEKLKASLGEAVDTRPERYGLTWSGKAKAFSNVQTASIGTLLPMLEESVNFDTSGNLILEGDNLEVLKLLQKSYHGKVKMIYIDPPYNTGNEFIYPDNYREGLDDYLKYSGQVNDEGLKQSTNTETSGRFHSKWLNMMYPRLFLARNLLREDGVIFVSIDDNEVHNLRMLMNEIFGEDGFVATFIWEKRTTRENRKIFSFNHDYLLCYARNLDIFQEVRGLLPMTEDVLNRYSNPDNDPKGKWQSISLAAQAGHGTSSQFYDITTPSGRAVSPPPGSCWRFTKRRFDELVEEGKIWFGADGNNVPRLKSYLTDANEGLTPHTLWKAEEVSTTDIAKKEFNAVFNGEIDFETIKPGALLKRLLHISTKPNEEALVLDFFAGSGSTAQAVIEQNKEDGGNRKFILVQLPERTENSQYPTIAHITRERVRRIISKLNESDTGRLNLEGNANHNFGYRAFKLSSSNFKIWDANQSVTDAQQLAEQLQLYADNVESQRSQKDILFELVLKAGLPLSSNVEQIEMEGKLIYAIAERQLLICLENPINQALLRFMMSLEPLQILCLDGAFQGNDPLKTNAVLEAKSHGITFRTV